MSECSNSMKNRPEAKKLPPNWFQPFLCGTEKENLQMLSPSDLSLNSLRENHTASAYTSRGYETFGGREDITQHAFSESGCSVCHSKFKINGLFFGTGKIEEGF